MASRKEIEAAIWAGDVDTLQEIAGCQCCCSEHTFGSGCPAYEWGGCRGQGIEEFKVQEREYARWYVQVIGMPPAKFHRWDVRESWIGGGDGDR